MFGRSMLLEHRSPQPGQYIKIKLGKRTLSLVQWKIFWSNRKALLPTRYPWSYVAFCMLLGHQLTHKKQVHNWSLIWALTMREWSLEGPEMKSTQNFSLGGYLYCNATVHQMSPSSATTRDAIVVVFSVVLAISLASRVVLCVDGYKIL